MVQEENLKQGSAPVSSQIFSTYHLTLIGPPLIFISIFCFGFVMAHPYQHTAAQLSSATHPKPAPPAIKPPSGLLLSPAPEISSLSLGSPDDDISADPETTGLPPQASSIAGTALQSADQRKDSGPGGPVNNSPATVPGGSDLPRGLSGDR